MIGWQALLGSIAGDEPRNELIKMLDQVPDLFRCVGGMNHGHDIDYMVCKNTEKFETGDVYITIKVNGDIEIKVSEGRSFSGEDLLEMCPAHVQEALLFHMDQLVRL
jgi:hypothetical protein